MQKQPLHINNLRTALQVLDEAEHEIERISAPVEGWCELAARYAQQGGGVPVRPPTRHGPAMLFERVQPQDRPVLVGLFGTRQRCARLLDVAEDRIGERLLDAALHPVTPIRREHPPCQEIVLPTPVDLGMLPIPTLTPKDAGPYIALGLVMARDPISGASNISVHRLCVQDRDRLTIWMVPGRDLESFYLNAKALGRPLPISIHIGLDPAVYIASCCSSPLAPLGSDELEIAGALRGQPIEISSCISVPTDCLSQAEYVLEGEITHEIMPENRASDGSMPEFLGYNGKGHPGLPIVRITAITQRREALFQTVIGPGYEQSNLLAFGMEAMVLYFLRQHVSKRVVNAYCSSAGGGQLLLFLQFRKEHEQDDGVVRRAGTALLGAFRMIKQVVLVDEDVDVFSEEDVWWAMTTRFQADQDILTVSNVQGFPLDPSQNPTYASSITSPGFTTKAVFDCTVPFRLKQQFQRTEFRWPLDAGQ